MISSEQRAFDSALASSSRQTITVKAGDSLWSIAEAYDIEGLSTRQTSDIIRAWNDLETSTLQPGDTLVVPLS